LTRRDSESDIDFARRVFLAIRSKFRYEYKAELERHASAVCTAGKSDCGGLSILFVAVMRANEIPARSLYGRWAQSAKPGDKADGAAYYQWHVKAEFFATGVGWVPIDMAGAIVHDKSFVGLEFFGKDKGDFITFHIDPNLTVDTKVSGQQTLVGLQRPAYWVRGLGTFDQHKEVEDWKVK